jgi:PAS domain S-box-containing protein
MGARSPELSSSVDDAAWALLEAAPDGMLIVDVDGLTVYVSDHAAALLHAPADELLGRSVEDFVPADLRHRHHEHRARYGAEPTVRPMGAGLLLRARCLDGSEFPVEISLSPLTIAGRAYTVAALRDVTERVDAEAHLRAAMNTLALADDRERIARDLHDTVIQRLFGAGLQLQGAMAAADPQLRDRLQVVVDDLDDTIRELRAAIFALQGPGPAPRGLRGRLLDVVRDAGASLGFEPRLQFEGAIETMDDTIAEHLVAVLREALSNVARHAQAHDVRVTVAAGDEVVLTVVDDGVGMPGAVAGGRGLVNLADRAADLGGRFEVERATSGGTRLEWRVPAETPVAMP